MELRIAHETGYVMASTMGSIDDSARDLFRSYLHPLVEQSGTKLILDLAQSKSITSPGLGELVALAANANANASRVVLAGCTPFVAISISRCKLNRFLELADTVAEAIRIALDG